MGGYFNINIKNYCTYILNLHLIMKKKYTPEKLILEDS